MIACLLALMSSNELLNSDEILVWMGGWYKDDVGLGLFPRRSGRICACMMVCENLKCALALALGVSQVRSDRV